MKPLHIFGKEFIEQEAIEQLQRAMSLPIAVAGALCPDAHKGYGFPIGGVLATDNAVIPYAVGVDIACRMRLTVFGEDSAFYLIHDSKERQLLREAIFEETRFGVGCEFPSGMRTHEVMDDPRWEAIPWLKDLRDRAAKQLGTSGSGNHFVEFGVFKGFVNIDECLQQVGYLALLSHSGSRALGGKICEHYYEIAKQECPQLEGDMKHFSWLGLNSDAGREYWMAMDLAARYAQANHELIHKHIQRRLGLPVAYELENHHNLAWVEVHAGQEVVVHRKGATPAHALTRGIIPGSMATPGYIVQGRGSVDSLCSASHGAGRAMSRKAAKRSITKDDRDTFLRNRNVELISGDLDEAPQAYKDIDTVMSAQTDLIDILGVFNPSLVKMAPAGEKAED